jgi:hypothetical protein
LNVGSTTKASPGPFDGTYSGWESASLEGRQTCRFFADHSAARCPFVLLLIQSVHANLS